MKKYLFSVLFLSCCMATSLLAAELETIENATLIEAGLNDGDSFKAQANGKELHLRLYYVDCLETTAGSKADKNRALNNNIISASKTPLPWCASANRPPSTSNGSCPGHSPFIPVMPRHQDVRPRVATMPLSKPMTAVTSGTSWSSRAWPGYTAKPTRPLTARQARFVSKELQGVLAFAIVEAQWNMEGNQT